MKRVEGEETGATCQCMEDGGRKKGDGGTVLSVLKLVHRASGGG